MKYWLLKTEPETYGWENLIQKGEDIWDGVRNYTARNNIRAMSPGDIALFYHSGKNPGIVGTVQISTSPYPDPSDNTNTWTSISVKPLERFSRVVSLKEIKGVESLQEMALLKQTRLSVQPVDPACFEIIKSMSRS